MIGSSIAHYRVTAKIGAGGMGEVYRATDSKLGRDVALKVLPPAFAQDAQRMQRFQREAQVLASLNHPNIAAIYGIEHDGSTQALAMELVEGPTLAERIAQGAIPLEEALVLAGQIVEALEAAHEKGIVHRDLKPANIKVSPEGKVKVLDFGLAKALDEDKQEGDISASPTLSMAATRAGIILGTAAYMSPEQARGGATDRRADIWSFGVVFFEMLTGKQLFAADSVSDTLAAVLRDEVPLDKLPATTPHHVRKLLRRCLERDRKRRLRDIGEARLAIEEYLASPADASVLMSAVSTAAPAAWHRALPWALAGVLAISLVAALVALRRPTPTPEVVRFDLELGPSGLQGGRAGSRVVISPDARKIVFIAQRAGTQTPQLYLRSLDNVEITALPGTENGHQPFFSPDSQWLGFSVDGKLKKIPLAGGVPVTLCDAPGPRGAAATWADNGFIFFVGDQRQVLKRVPEGGGTPEQVLEPDAAKDERFAWVAALPGSRGVLVVATENNQFHTDVVTLQTRQRTRVVENGSWPRYLPTGHILYAQHSASGATSGFTGGLLVIPFDLKNLARTGSPIPVLEGARAGSGGAGFYDVAADGTLVYAPGAPESGNKRLAWLDRSGKVEVITAPLHAFRNISVSPDGTRVAAAISASTEDIQVYDLKRSTLQRLTFEGASESPIYSPDGTRIIYALREREGGPFNLWWRAADGSGTAERLTTSEFNNYPSSVSPDGKLLAFTANNRQNSTDVYVMPLHGDRKPQPFLATPFNESAPRFSPDGKWIAYSSNESGRTEVFVQAYPGPGGKIPISTSGGGGPKWSRDGKLLYYMVGDSIMAVEITTQPVFRAGTPRVVGEALAIAERFNRNFDPAPDGRILLAQRPGMVQQDSVQLRVVQNFATEVRRRLPSDKQQ